jgi:hypothetical protein
MAWLLELKLLRLFDFYLVLCFLIGTLLRVQQYRTILGVVRSMPSRWPRLFQLIKQHRHILLTWGTILPLASTLLLWLAHTIFRRLFLPGTSDLTVERLLHNPMALVVVTATGLAMLSFDLYGMWRVAPIDQPLLEKYFDQAEYWLRSWTAPVVRVFTLGYINPRKIVAVEVRGALESASRIINNSLWWMSIQTSLRLAFGLSLWTSYALLHA